MVLLSSTRRGQVLTFQSGATGRRALSVVSVTGVEAISTPYRFDLGLVSLQADLDAEALLRFPASLGIKQSVLIRSGTSHGIQTLRIHGILSSFRQSERGREWVAYEAVLVPRLWLLSQTRQNRIFLDKTVREIVTEVLEEAGLTRQDFEFQLSAREYPRSEYVVQHQESDLAFLSRLLEREGISYRFAQEDDRERILFWDEVGAYPPIVGGRPLLYQPASEGGDSDWWRPEAIHTWVCDQRRLPREVVLKDYDDRHPSLDLQVTASVSRDGTGRVYEYGDHYGSREEGQALARIRAEEIRCRGTVYHGTGDGRSFRAGETFALASHYRHEFNRRYLLTRVTHRAEQAMAAASPAAVVASYANEFTAIPADQIFRPERTTPRPRIEGVIQARVDAAGSGEYAELDAEGRYKVRIPFDLSGRAGGAASHYIRMAQPYAGAGYGFHFPLHKGTEVILTHVHGDPDRPVIAAAVPNPETRSPVTNANPTECVARSCADNRIVLDDLSGSERILIRAERDFHLRVGNAARESVGGDRIEHVAGKVHEKVGGNFNLKSGGMYTVKSKEDMFLVSRADQWLKSFQNMHVISDGALGISASRIMISARENVTIRCGQNGITVSPSGIYFHSPTTTAQTPVVVGSGTPLLSPGDVVVELAGTEETEDPEDMPIATDAPPSSVCITPGVTGGAPGPVPYPESAQPGDAPVPDSTRPRSA